MTIDIAALAAAAPDRTALWQSIINELGVRTMAEVGVFRGMYAEAVLDGCPSLETYYMVDPWRHLDDWEKPANRSDDVFEKFYAETMDRTKQHADKRVVLRGKTTEVIDQIPDGSLDFAYIDGDHTLRGITIDLIRIWPKIKPGGWLGGDDLHPSIFQHGDDHEPTLVFPWALHFAEAVDSPIAMLPYRQFLLPKDSEESYEVVNLTERPYKHRTIKSQLALRRRRLRAMRQARQQAEQTQQSQ